MSQVTGSDTFHVAGSDTCHVAGSDNMTLAVDTCPLDSVAQDSGISSTSDSTISYSTKNINLEMEDLSKVPWYEAEMPRDDRVGKRTSWILHGSEIRDSARNTRAVCQGPQDFSSSWNHALHHSQG